MMSDAKNTTIFNSFIPSSIKGKVILILIIVLTFSLGMILSGTDSPQTVSESDHDVSEHTKTEWTCSMHPQIILPVKGKCPICFMDLIPLERNSDNGLAPNQLKLSVNARQLAQIESSEVIQGTASRSISMVGKITYDETKLGSVTARAGGRLDTLFADFTGQSVFKGDKLVSLYSPELYAAQEEMIQAVQTLQKLKDSNSQVLQSTAFATVTAAREKLRLLGLSDSQIETVENSKKASANLTVLAQQDGVIIERAVTEGSYVTTGTVIYKIANLDTLWVMFEAYETDLPWLSKNRKISFTAKSVPSRIFTSEVSFIDPVIDPQKRTARVRAVIANKNNMLKPDMFVSGKIEGSINEDKSLLIPLSAPLLTGERAIVYVEIASGEDIIYEGREVSLGGISNEYYIVKSGLKAGERVVTNGAFKIDSELQIQAKPSMMSAPDKKTPKNQTPTNMITEVSENTEIPIEAVSQLTPLYTEYFGLQMALADDDYDQSIKAYEKINEALSKIEMKLFHGSAHESWMNYAEKISTFTLLGIKSKDIENSRDQFFHLSNTIIMLQKEFGHSEARDYYLTFCPMARNNKGAYWLQTVDTVYNSFYGDMMLHCGEIKETFPDKSKRINQ